MLCGALKSNFLPFSNHFRQFKHPKRLISTSYWDCEQNVSKFIEQVRKHYNLQSFEDWNSLTKKQISALDKRGNSLFKRYCLTEIKCLGYPQGTSIFTKSPPKPRNYWDNKDNIQNFLQNLQEKLNLKTFEDWNSLTQKDIQLHGGGTLINKYSMFELKSLGYPEGKFKKQDQYKPIKYWDNKENILQFLEELKVKFKLKTFEDWNAIKKKHIQSLYGGNSLLTKYSIYEIKCLGFPDGKLKFNLPPKSPGFWNDNDNILQFLNELKEKLHFKTPEDWNLLTYKQFLAHGGGRLLSKFSLFELKCLACPEGILYFDKPNHFKPPGYWNNEENINQFLNELKEKLNLKNPEDWNRLSKNQISFLGGSTNKFSVKKIIQLQNFDKSTNLNPNFKRSSQRWLFLQVQKLFPHEEIVEDYFHSELSRESGCSIQFDIFLIHKKIAFEYHGEHHFEDIPSGFAPVEMYKNRDKEKANLCEKFGIKLIIIPYWWDCKLDSLKVFLENFKE